MYSRSRFYPSPIPSGSADVNVGRFERVLSVGSGILMAVSGIRSRSLLGIAGAITGAGLIYRGLSGHCDLNARFGRDSSRSDDQPRPVHVRTSMTVAKPRDEVYAAWRKLENLPSFMKHLSAVQTLDERRSEWSAEIPGKLGTVSWEAEIVNEDPGRRIVWRSVAGADVDNSGQVEFADAPGGRGTELRAEIAYRPPAGYIGAQMGKWLNPAFERMVREDVRRFKELMEAGEFAGEGGTASGVH